MPHTIYFLMFVTVAILATVSLRRVAKVSQSHSPLTVVSESYARADAAIVAARQERQHARAHCVSASSGRGIAVELLGVNPDGTLRLRRRGHPHSAPFNRSTSAMFSR